MTRTVVVTDGDERSALATVRSLGRAGSRVHVCAHRRRSLAGASRYSISQTEVADPLRSPERFVDEVVAIAEKVSADVIFPISEASLLAVLPARERFDARIPFPPADVFEQVADKALVLARAKALGIAVPAQVVLGDAAAISDSRSLSFPVVVKPSRSVPRSGSERRKSGVGYARNREELAVLLSDVHASAYPVLLQEKIEGPGMAVSLLIWDGEAKGAFAHRRIREKPPTGGVSVLSEAIELDPVLLEQSVRLLESFSWQGVAMVEYKVEARSGKPYLMEINGRMWGSIQLAIDSGVDFPLLLLRAAMDEPMNGRPVYRHGTRLHWEWGDVDNLIASVRRKHNGAGNRDSGRASALRGFVSSFRPGIRAEVLRLSDPVPFARETLDWWKATLS